METSPEAPAAMPFALETALRSMGYRPLGSGTRMWAKPVAFSMFTFSVQEKAFRYWFLHASTQEPLVFDKRDLCADEHDDLVSIQEQIKNVEAAFFGEFSPWRGAWSKSDWCFLTREEQALLALKE